MYPLTVFSKSMKIDAQEYYLKTGHKYIIDPILPSKFILNIYLNNHIKGTVNIYSQSTIFNKLINLD